MSQYLTLLRVMMKPGSRNFGLARKKTNSKGTLIAALLVLAVCFGFTFAILGFSFGMMASPAYFAAAVFTIALTAIQALLLLFGVAYLLSVMYFSKDNEFLLSLPVKNSTIFLAKITAVYLYLFIIGTFSLLAFGIPFGITAGLSANFYLTLIPAALLLPLAPIFLATVLSFPLMYIVSFFKRSRMLTTILVILLVAAFAGFYIWMYSGGLFNTGMGDGGSSSGDSLIPEAVMISISNATRYIFFTHCFAGIGIQSDHIVLDVVSLFGSYIAFGALTYLLSASLYRKGMARQLEAGGEVITKNKDFKTNSPVKALVYKELRMLVRTPIMLFYCLLEMVFPILFLFIFSRSLTADAMLVGNIPFMQTLMLCMALFFGLVFACGMNFVALSSVSREGKNFYLMRTLPVPIAKQLEIKSLIALTMPILSVLIVSIWLLAIGMISVFSGICYFIFMCILSYGFTYFQVGLDIKRPRLDYENVAQILQNNTNSFVTMGVNFLFFLAAGLLSVGATFLSVLIVNQFLTELLLWAVLLCGAGFSSYLFRRSYLKNVMIRFDRIEP